MQQLDLGNRTHLVCVGHGNIKADACLRFGRACKRHRRRCFCFGLDLTRLCDLMDSLAVVQVIRIRYLHRIRIIGKQGIKASRRKIGCYDRGIFSMQQLDLGNRTNTVGVGCNDLKANARLRGCRFGNRQARRRFAKRFEIERNRFFLSSVGVLRHQRVFGARQKIGHTHGIHSNIRNLILSPIQRNRIDLLCSKTVIPPKCKAEGFLEDLHRIKQHNGFGTEGLLGQDISMETGSVQRVVVCSDRVLVDRIGLQISELHRGRFSQRDILRCNCGLPVVKDRHQGALASRNQLYKILDGNLERNIVKSDYLIFHRRNRLPLGGNADTHGLVTFHANVLDFRTVNVFDGIDGVFHNTFHVSHVDLQDQIFHIRAVLEHIA